MSKNSLTGLLILLLAGVPCFGQASRIVSTAPSITETLFALGLGSRVVGVTNYCSYPPEAKTKTRIGTYLDPDVESIAALHPDLVVVERLPNHLSEELKRLTIPFVEVDHSTVEDVFEANRLIANAAGVPGEGRRLNERLRLGIAEIRARASRSGKPTVVFVVGHTPGRLEDLIVAGGRSYFTELLETAGAKNAFADTMSQYPGVSLETILGRDPDFVIEMSGPSLSKKAAIIALWGKQQSLQAVRRNHVVTVPADVFQVPGPRVLEACINLTYLLHPELYR